MALSRERIAAELLKLLVARHAVPVIALMIDRGIFRAVAKFPQDLYRPAVILF